MFVVAARETALLAIVSEAFILEARATIHVFQKVQQNLMGILSRKACFTHTKLKVMASGSLRERIVRFLFWEMGGKDNLRLSRELGAMQREGILSLDGKEIIILDQEKFEEYL